MGFLTTLTIYNDGIHLLEPHAKEFAQEVFHLAAALRGPADVPLGHFANAVRVQKSRHASNDTIYIHSGNCVTEFHPNSEETRAAMAHPAFFEKRLKILEQAVRDLKRMYKEHKAGQQEVK